jgi:hypothetical protein
LILFGLAVVAALGCVAASAERVRKVLSVAHFELDGLRPAQIGAAPAGSIEAELAEALREAKASGLERDLAVDQVVFEADFALSRWKMVPRMAARISSSCGFLLAAAQLRSILADLGDSVSVESVSEPLVMSALQIVAAALAGTSICLALGKVAEKARRVESGQIDAFLDRARGEVAPGAELFGRPGVEA